MPFRVHDRVASHLIPGGKGRVVRVDRPRDCYLVLADLHPVRTWIPGEAITPAPAERTDTSEES